MNNLKKGYNIAVHGINDSKNSKIRAEKILMEGLRLPGGAWSICSTTIQIGDKYRNSQFDEQMEYIKNQYSFGINSEGFNIIVLTPTVISNSKGEELFLGDPFTGNIDADFSNLDSSRKYISTCILDEICKNLGKIPAEFIYGYVDINNGKIIKNPIHYSNDTENRQEELDAFFESLKNNLEPLFCEISEAIVTRNITLLKQLIQLSSTYSVESIGEIINKANREYDILNEDVSFDDISR